ncbi:major facilitator superfamily domain-containing protein 5 [Hibiscus syriacus]|uniref:F-box protein n=1 Tax=Hibiscus syriacus TaxID=106335 RepID=A0A6A3BT79_HIBSY|nr:uncharacterized protein LOC120210625 [Hibiscus syriacus]KAE8719705.1 major facilitator superfamily domain-containing protein 5 [Hibiscus syriacus]
MEKLPCDICLKIFCFLDHHNLASALQVCRKWKALGSDNLLWSNLFKDRWGVDQAAFYAPDPMHSTSWKDVYETQDRCDRVGLGLKIIREGGDYFLVHQGKIQRYLGSRLKRKGAEDCESSTSGQEVNVEEPCRGILDKILFFLGDLEAASDGAKRGRVL